MSLKCADCGAPVECGELGHRCVKCQAWSGYVPPKMSTEGSWDYNGTLPHTIIDSHMTSTGTFQKIETAGFSLRMHFDTCNLLIKRDGTVEINGEWNDVARMFWKQLGDMGVGYAKQNAELKVALRTIQGMCGISDASEACYKIIKFADIWLERCK